MEYSEFSGDYPTTRGHSATRHFGKMVVFSLLAHAVFSTALVLTSGGNHVMGPVQYLDLKMMETPAPSTPVKAVEKPVAVQEQEKTVQPLPPVAIEKNIEEQKPAEAATVRPELFKQGSLGLGIANGHFGSISDGRTLRDDMREYYLEMLAKFNETWWQTKAGDLESTRDAAFLAIVSRDGTIVDMQLLRSSGNPSHDRLMLRSLRDAGPLRALPDSYSGDFFSAPLRFVGPLNLMSPFSG